VHVSKPPEHTTYLVAVVDSGFHRLTCRHGHKSSACLQALRFEVLAELAATAIVDGYYREAISSFAASLERFYEFYLALVFEKRGLNATVHAATWKQVVSQSERQLGAFLFVCALDEQRAPPVFPAKFVKLRNEVVHKGKIPSQAEAIEYGQAIIDYLAPILAKVAATSADASAKIVTRQLIATQVQHHQEGHQPSTLWMPMAIQLGPTQVPLEQTLLRISRAQHR
jgi:hypothetical protein